VIAEIRLVGRFFNTKQTKRAFKTVFSSSMDFFRRLKVEVLRHLNSYPKNGFLCFNILVHAPYPVCSEWIKFIFYFCENENSFVLWLLDLECEEVGDVGANYYTVGSVTNYEDPRFPVWTDVCQKDIQPSEDGAVDESLWEFSCSSDGSGQKEIKNCAEGIGNLVCRDGACRQGTFVTVINIFPACCNELTHAIDSTREK